MSRLDLDEHRSWREAVAATDADDFGVTVNVVAGLLGAMVGLLWAFVTSWLIYPLFWIGQGLGPITIWVFLGCLLLRSVILVRILLRMKDRGLPRGWVWGRLLGVVAWSAFEIVTILGGESL